MGFLTSITDRVRNYAASVDGSLLDDATWRTRHRRVQAIGWLLTIFVFVFTLLDHEQLREQWIYTGVSVVFALLGGVPQLSRRGRQTCTALVFVVTQLYFLRFVGNFALGPVTIILLTFYQDWVPVVVGCVLVIATVVVAWADPVYYNGTRGLQQEVPLTGMGMRAVAILLSAALGLAVWRAGTQQGRDQLTGMLSRAGAERRLDRECARGRQPAVWVCDLDNFSSVNTMLGPAVGDVLLKQVGTRLRTVARTLPGSWFCARLGGDTFLLGTNLVPSEEFVSDFAHRIEASAGLTPAAVSGDEVPVRLSVGAASAVDGEPGASLIRVAERNMRDAKGTGMLRVVVGQRADRAVDPAESLLVAELYRACRQGELELYLQPIVDLSTGMPVGAETLVRWHHPSRGLVMPGEFLPEAERDSALMALVSGTLGAAFLRLVSRLVHSRGADWLSYGYSYNLAAVRLRDPLLREQITRHLSEADLHPGEARLHLEVTEGALMDVEHHAPQILSTFRQTGYGLALDDFGTGHSSLAHLRDFPISTVKIDKSFVRAIERSPTDRAVVQAVADIAAVSGLTVVVEGVETEGQRDILLEVSPQLLAQGWLYAKAMPVTEFEQWVAERKRATLS